MIYNYTKCESVIAKIMADLDSSEIRQRTSDIREWIFEAVDKIGAPMQYISKESGEGGFPILMIEDYQVPIPEDLHILDGVAYSVTPHGPWKPMKTSTSIFKHNKHRGGIGDMREHLIPHLTTSQSQFYTINTMKYLNRMTNDGQLEQPEYFIKPGWIVTNQRHGFIKLAYKAIATDERGYPLIPDSTSYQEAIYWYVVMKLSFPKMMNGSLGGGGSRKGVNTAFNTYAYIQQQWNFYRNQAYAEAMMPTADDMQNIKNDWNKLLPDWDGDDTFFKNIGTEQITYNDYHVH